jgi:hypothetical protein
VNRKRDRQVNEKRGGQAEGEQVHVMKRTCPLLVY